MEPLGGMAATCGGKEARAGWRIRSRKERPTRETETGNPRSRGIALVRVRRVPLASTTMVRSSSFWRMSLKRDQKSSLARMRRMAKRTARTRLLVSIFPFVR
jgi:hypothetical protein